MFGISAAVRSKEVGLKLLTVRLPLTRVLSRDLTPRRLSGHME